MKNKSLIIPILFIALSFCLIFYVYYKSQIIFNGEKISYYKPYYYISFCLLSFSIFSFFLSENLLKNLILIFISIIISGYLIEIFFQISNFGRKNTDPMTQERRLSFYKELKETSGVNLVAVPPSAFLSENEDLLPLSGHSNNKNFYCHKGQYNILNHDRYGFNNPDSEWDEINIEFLVIGDSNVYGACVKENENIVGNLRSLSNENVINLGQMSNGPLLEYATLKEYFLKDKIDRVLWIYYEGNDLENLIFEKKIQILNKYLNDNNFSQNLKTKQALINKLVITKIEQTYNEAKDKITNKRMADNINFNIKQFLKLYLTRQFVINFFLREKLPIEKFTEIMKKTKEFTDENNTSLYFIYLPDHYRYLKDKTKDYKLYKEIINKMSELNINTIDLHENLFGKINALEFMDKNDRGYNHYNEKGNEIIAKTIYEYILKFEKKIN